MSLFVAAVIAIGVLVYSGMILVLSRFLSFALGDNDHDDNA